jgi:DNA-binding transcriptional regulator GbsR (MarR family)
MLDHEKYNNILNLTSKIVKNYLENNKVGHVKILKQKMKDLLTDPLWDDKLIFQLKKEFEELKVPDNEFNVLWENIEKTLDASYEELNINKHYLFDVKIREYERRLIDFFVRAGKLKSQSSTLSTIIGCLLIHKHQGLTQAQLKELTGLSKGAISTNLKLLMGSPILKKQLIKGTREYSYSFGGDFSAIASGTGMYKYETNDVAKNFLNTKISELEKVKDKNGYKILSQRIDDILYFLKIHRKLIKFITESEFVKEL